MPTTSTAQQTREHGTIGHTLYGSPYGFSQDRGSDISQFLFLWLDSLVYSGGPSGVETKACVPSSLRSSSLPAAIWGFLLIAEAADPLVTTGIVMIVTAGAIASWR
jgi:hypothetical protein